MSIHLICPTERVRTTLVVLLGLFLITGCSKTTGKKPVFPVRGEVFFQNKPCPGALIVFHPKDATGPVDRPHAYVKEDGSFVLSTFGEEDGAPEGEYNITVVWHRKSGGFDRERSESGPDLLQGAYGNPQQPRLPPISIKSGENQLPRIDLK